MIETEVTEGENGEESGTKGRGRYLAHAKAPQQLKSPALTLQSTFSVEKKNISNMS